MALLRDCRRLFAFGCSGSQQRTDESVTPVHARNDRAPAAVHRPCPPALPQHFGLGLMNNSQQLDWMTTSGIPWDYRYQYLTGGVNTGNGWTTWGYSRRLLPR